MRSLASRVRFKLLTTTLFPFFKICSCVGLRAYGSASNGPPDTFSDCSTAWPSGIKPVPLPMDGDGLTVDGMEQVLANWNPDEHDGMQR